MDMKEYLNFGTGLALNFLFAFTLLIFIMEMNADAADAVAACHICPPISFQLRYTFFMPTQLIVFCAKKCFAVKAEIITPHKRWDCEVYGPDIHTHTHSNKNPACFAFF